MLSDPYLATPLISWAMIALATVLAIIETMLARAMKQSIPYIAWKWNLIPTYMTLLIPILNIFLVYFGIGIGLATSLITQELCHKKRMRLIDEHYRKLGAIKP